MSFRAMHLVSGHSRAHRKSEYGFYAMMIIIIIIKWTGSRIGNNKQGVWAFDG